MAFDLTKNSTTPAGIIEFLSTYKAKPNSSLYVLFPNLSKDLSLGIKINYDTLKVIRGLHLELEQLQSDIPSDEKAKIKKCLIDNLLICLGDAARAGKILSDSFALNFLNEISATSNNSVFAQLLHDRIDSQGVRIVMGSIIVNRDTMVEELSELYKLFNDLLTTANSLAAKLFIIIDFIQAAERIHPFLDANCRTLCMLSLYNLLKDNGFPIPIPDDANKFDGHARNELFLEVIKWMKNTFTLIKEHQLNNVKTDEVIQYLHSKSNDTFKNAIQYFDEVVEVELAGRMKMSAKLN